MSRKRLNDTNARKERHSWNHTITFCDYRFDCIVLIFGIFSITKKFLCISGNNCENHSILRNVANTYSHWNSFFMFKHTSTSPREEQPSHTFHFIPFFKSIRRIFSVVPAFQRELHAPNIHTVVCVNCFTSVVKHNRSEKMEPTKSNRKTRHKKPISYKFETTLVSLCSPLSE